MLALINEPKVKVAHLLKTAAFGAALLCLAPYNAHAVITAGNVLDGATFLGFFAGNDCEGGAFPDCYASQSGVNVSGNFESSVIYKIDNPTGSDTGNFASITGSEFDLNYVDDVMSWLYTPGAGDPSIHYFDIKQANGYALFYSQDPILSWEANILTNLGYNDFSHVTWFDTTNGGSTSSSGGSTSSSGGSTSSSGGSTSSSTSGGPGPGEVPEPAALSLLGLGLLGLGLQRRRQKHD